MNHIDISNIIPLLEEPKEQRKTLELVFKLLQSDYDLVRPPFQKTYYKSNIDNEMFYFLCIDKKDGIEFSVLQNLYDENHKIVFEYIRDKKAIKVYYYSDGEGQELNSEAEEALVNSIIAPMYTNILLNCKNTKLINEPKSGLKQLLNKHKRKPLVIFKILIIEPLKPKSTYDYESIETGRLMPLHICRGHIRNYKSPNLLFGKFEGRFYIHSHIRGNRENGEIIKDYLIK